MIILAIDAGIQTCGYAVVGIRGNDVHLIKQGETKPRQKDTMPQKLNAIIESLDVEVAEYKPQAIVVETLYSHHRHPVTLGILAQVKGAIAVFSHRWGIDYFEFSTTRARKSFLGKGNVDSQRVKKMAENMTGTTFDSVHTADAYSLAAAFAHEWRFNRLCRQTTQ